MLKQHKLRQLGSAAARAALVLFQHKVGLIAVATAATAVVTGCRGDDAEPDIAAAVALTEATSWRFAMEGEVMEGRERVREQCAGFSDESRARFQLSCQGAVGSQPLQVRVIGNTALIRDRASSPKWRRNTVDRERWLRGLAPHSLLSLLRSATVATEHPDAEGVHGSSTVRYTVTVKCDSPLLAACGTEIIPVDVWVGADGTLRRIAFDVRSASGTVDFFDFGADFDVQPPPHTLIEDFGTR